MKWERFWSAIASGFVVLFVPAVALAAGLVSCGTGAGLENATSCQACNLVELLQRLINFAIGISIPIAMILFTYAGVLYFSSNENTGRIAKAHSIFKNVVIGFAIILTAYLVVNTVLHIVLDPSYYVGWNTVRCSQGDRPRDKSIGELLGVILGNGGVTTGGPQCPTGFSYSSQFSTCVSADGKTANPISTPLTGDVYNEAAARDILKNENIDINHDACAGGIAAGCTDLNGIQRNTLVQVINLKNACGCSLTITGGTEQGHELGTYSHSTGYKVDLGFNSALDSYITSNYTYSGVRSDGAALYKDHNGNIYAKESNHWDVFVTKVGP